MKKAIMLLVDSLMPEVLEDAIRHKTVPALQFLIERGKYWPNCVTVFPTMTASVDSSLVTGTYPDVHKVPGLIWYDPEEKKLVNYMNGWQCVSKLGISTCARNVLYHLNEKHLSREVTTIFEELAYKGKTSASINAMVHRGVKKHPVRLPFLLDLATGFRLRGDISGPDVLTMGAFARSGVGGSAPEDASGIRNMYGINDKYAVNAVKTLVEQRNQPDFMLVYLPDNDHRIHKNNPAHAETSLIQVDKQIQEILSAFGSWDKALHHCAFIVVSDHGQTRIGDGKEFNIDLDALLQPYRVLQLGEKVGDHDLVIANNERMAYIYPLNAEKQQEVIGQLAGESRLDIISWKEEEGVRVMEGGSGREMVYRPDGPVSDMYGSAWSISGEWRVLDLDLRQDDVEYGDYPDVLARLYGALYSQDIPVIVITARPRYELKSRHHPTHLNGGSHGSLHKYDSQIPLIVAGTDHPVGASPRLVDMKQLVVGLLEC